jgi:hypothetical protein
VLGQLLKQLVARRRSPVPEALAELEAAVGRVGTGVPGALAAVQVLLAPGGKLAERLERSAHAGHLRRAIALLRQVAHATDGELRCNALNLTAHCLALAHDVEAAAALYGEANRLAQAAAGGAAATSFDLAYERGLAVTRTWESPRRRPRFRRLLQLFERTLGRPGEVAECGCWRGLSSFLMCSRQREFDSGFDGAGFHVLDSFAGLSVPEAIDEVAPAVEGMFAAGLEHVRRSLDAFPGVELHPGWIPGSLSDLPERAYRFVHLDLDLHAPTAGALAYFHPRLAPGGLIVCDDFNWPGARAAISGYCSERRIAFTTTDANQAVIEGG